jgi:hypothetical protein
MGIFQGHIFIIDTDKYSGNFERFMCGYITGQVGECGVGEDEATKAKKELGNEEIDFFEYHTEHVEDEGCHRPCSIWPTPGFFNDGKGTHWPEGTPEDIVRETYVKKTKEWVDKVVSVNEAHVARDPEKNGHLRKVIAGHKQKLEDAKTSPLRKWPAYQSVAIFFNKSIPEEIATLMRERAEKYAKKKGIEILGFRVLEVKIEEVK